MSGRRLFLNSTVEGLVEILSSVQGRILVYKGCIFVETGPSQQELSDQEEMD